MKFSTFATAICAVLLLSGCSTFSKASERNLYQVHLGESAADMVAALGEPASRSNDGGFERWYYNIYSRDNREIMPYTATFKDGVLQQWNYDSSRKTAEEPRYDFNRMPSSHY